MVVAVATRVYYVLKNAHLGILENNVTAFVDIVKIIQHVTILLELVQKDVPLVIVFQNVQKLVMAERTEIIVV